MMMRPGKGKPVDSRRTELAALCRVAVWVLRACKLPPTLMAPLLISLSGGEIVGRVFRSRRAATRIELSIRPLPWR